MITIAIRLDAKVVSEETGVTSTESGLMIPFEVDEEAARSMTPADLYAILGRWLESPEERIMFETFLYRVAQRARGVLGDREEIRPYPADPVVEGGPCKYPVRGRE